MPRRRQLLATPALAAGAWAQGRQVDTLLVLAMDASGSIYDAEFRLQREGYAEALSHPEVLAAIRSRRHGCIAVAMLEWGSPGGSALVVGWMPVDGAATAQAAGDALLAAARSAQSYNAIGDALLHAGTLLREAPFAAEQRVVDLSGDGPDMRGRIPAGLARDALVRDGVVVNGLAIGATGGSLAEHYRRDVMGGAGAFVIEAADRRDLARALRAKLVREVS